MAERVFTREELKRYNGERGAPAYLAYDGVVYDVSQCPKWRGGDHEGLHFAGFDLSGELADAPHATEVFSRPCVRRVGTLEKERWETYPPGADARPPGKGVPSPGGGLAGAGL
jgi:predicted heme/steroid binding protein